MVYGFDSRRRYDRGAAHSCAAPLFVRNTVDTYPPIPQNAASEPFFHKSQKVIGQFTKTCIHKPDQRKSLAYTPEDYLRFVRKWRARNRARRSQPLTPSQELRDRPIHSIFRHPSPPRNPRPGIKNLTPLVLPYSTNPYFFRRKFGKDLADSDFRRTFALANQTMTDLQPALLAQLVEQLTLNQWVQGSNP